MMTQTSAGVEVARGWLRTAYGIVRVTATPRGLRQVELPRWMDDAAAAVRADDSAAYAIDESGDTRARRHLEQALAELDEYFAGERREFAVALDPVGAQFLQRVWRAVAA